MARAHIELASDIAGNIKQGVMPSSEHVRALDAALFTDDARFLRERTLFLNTPLIAAHSSELPEPKTMKAFDRLGLPIILVRTANGQVNAFYNVCRHRGTRLIGGGECVRRPTILCPYHNWSYSLDGDLIAVPLEEEGFPGLDHGAYRLRSVPAVEREGFIWLTVNGRDEDFAGHIDPLSEDFKSFGFPSHVVFRESTRNHKCNWKLIVNAFLESYHVKRLHKNTVGDFFLDNQAATEELGPHLRSAVARSEFKDKIADRPETWNDRTDLSYTHFVFPNVITVYHPDYISVIALFPKSAGETEAVHTMLIPHEPRSEDERAHWERSYDLINDGVFRGEDFWVSEQAQQGLESGALDQLTIGRFEYIIGQFHDRLDEAIGRLS